MRTHAAGLALLTFFFVSPIACAAESTSAYPARPIRLVVRYPPGAGTDFTARQMGEQFTKAMGQPVVIDHRPGAGATLGHTQRLKSHPDIPAIAETVPGYYNTGWWGIVAPAGTPKPIVEKLNGIMNSALATPELLQRFEKNGLEVATTTAQGFHDMLRADLKMWSKLIKDAKITVDVLP